VALGYTAQVIFTAELCVKVLAFGKHPKKYLLDPWNKLDGFVVFVGFVEMTPGRVIFEAFPVVVLRLLRLLRVFRLAKALPRLRSIVEALIKGFGSVGWICVLMLVFNYICGCMMMLLFAANDPFHFGSVGRR
jgi:voltage-gated sodium channel